MKHFKFETLFKILIVIEKETPQGKVIAYTMEINNLCDHVSEEGMPWSIFFQAMKLDPLACPIPAVSAVQFLIANTNI